MPLAFLPLAPPPLVSSDEARRFSAMNLGGSSWIRHSPILSFSFNRGSNPLPSPYAVYSQPGVLARQNLSAVPLAFAQHQVADSGHRIDVRVDPRAELAPGHAFDRRGPVGVLPPCQVAALDAQRREDALEHPFVQIAPVGQRDALGQPIRAGIAVVPLRAGAEQQLGVAARLFKPSRLRRQVQDRNLVQPTGPRVLFRRNAQSRVKPFRFFLQPQLPVFDGQAQRK